MAQLYKIQQEIFNYLYGKPVNETILSAQAQNELSIYRSLVLDGTEALLESIYPYCYQILADNWQPIVESYAKNHPSSSPIYNQQAKQFPEFLASDDFKANYNYPNYLAELALYEWSELTPVRKILKLKYPITQVIEYLKTTDDPIEEIRNTDIEEEPEIIVLYQDPESCKTRFFKLSETTLFIIECLEAGLDDTSICKNFYENFNIELEAAALETLVKELKNIGILLQ